MTTHPRRRWRTVAAAVVLTVAAAATGCGNPFAESEDTTVQTVTEADTKQSVTRYATEIAEAFEAELRTIGLNSAPCTGRRGEDPKDIYTTQGSYQVLVPEQRHAEILATLHQRWTEQGYKLEQYQRKPADPADRLIMYTPDDFRIRLVDTQPPIALALLISSPCRRSPTPLY